MLHVIRYYPDLFKTTKAFPKIFIKLKDIIVVWARLYRHMFIQTYV